MKGNIQFVVALSVALGTWSSYAYELGTHGALTYEAFKRSVLNPKPDDPADPQFLTKVLGIQNGPNPFGDVYYDISGITAQERRSQFFEQDPNARRMPRGTEPLSIEGWLMRGAIREDDVLEPDNGQPLDDPYNTGWWLSDNRVFNHFYDPAHDWALTGLITLGKKAPDGGLGTRDVFSQPATPEDGRRNHFTVLDAREAMYRALTGRMQNGTNISVPSGSTQTNERNKYWATTFRALGDVVHLVEDMAQPIRVNVAMNVALSWCARSPA